MRRKSCQFDFTWKFYILDDRKKSKENHMLLLLTPSVFYSPVLETIRFAYGSHRNVDYHASLTDF
jgi:hypothetical protein